MLDNEPHAIVENEFVKPGKGQAFNRVRLKNLKSGRVIDKTFKSGESIEAADVMDTEMQFLYSDGEFFHFMVKSQANIAVNDDDILLFGFQHFFNSAFKGFFQKIVIVMKL